MTRCQRVAVLVETSSGWGRRLIRGITSFVEKHQSWDIDIVPRDSYCEQTLPAGWNGDGVIARIRSARMAAALAKLKAPVVNVSGIELPGQPFPRVTTNFNGAAALAAEHFLQRGYTRFAYAGPLQQSYVARHAEAFGAAVRSARDQEIALFDTTGMNTTGMHGDGAHSDAPDSRPAHGGRGRAGASRNGKAPSNRITALGDWVKKLEHASGLFCWSIADAMLLLRLCLGRDIAVPDDIALLAGDDDSLLCNLTRPTLSGLVVASEQIGYQAAQRLDSLMRGEADDGKDWLIDPVEIQARGSTEALAIKDEELRRAMRFLRENAHREVSVDEVADFVPMSRRSLERRFRSQLGDSPQAQLQRLRLARVRRLLALTDLSIGQIAEQCGFANPVYMTAVFRQETGLTPRSYRNQSRAR